MAGIQGIGQGAGIGGAQGVGGNQGVGGLDALGGGQLGKEQIKQLFEQLVKKLLESQQQAQGGQQAGGAQQAQGAQNGGDQGVSLRDLIEQLKKAAQENPAAFKQLLAQNPQFQAVAQAALGGGAGGGAIGGAGKL